MKRIAPYIILVSIACVFFYKTILFGQIPFAGDLLLTQYAPWRHVSYFGYVAGAIPSKDQYFDVIRELYPWKTEVIRQIREKTIPLWNPYNFSGGPLLANFQSQVLYPLGFLYLLLPQIIVWTILIMAQPILGGVFTYLFAASIGISTGGALIAAIAFNFSSFANVWIQFNTVWHTVLWLPLLLYLVEKGIKNKRLHMFQQFLFVFALFSSITAGHPQDFINMFLFFLIYLAIRVMTLPYWSVREKFSFFAFCLLLSAISFFLAAPQLLPTIELFKNSARVPHDYKLLVNQMLIQPWQLSLIFTQDFFGNPATKTYFLAGSYVNKALSIGSVGFFLSLFSLSLLRKSRYVLFFLLVVIALLLLTVKNPLSIILYRYPIPILSTGMPTRILFIFCFSLSILAGFGFDAIQKAKRIYTMPILIISIIMSLLWSCTLLHPRFIGLTYTQLSFTTMKKAVLISSGFIGLSFLLILISKYKRIVLYGFLILISGELFYGFIKFNPFVPKGFVYPDNPLLTFFQNQKGIDRIWGYGTAQLEANLTTQYRLFSTDGTDPLNLKWYNEFIQSSRDGNIAKTFNRTTRSDAQLAPGYGEKDLPDNPYRLRVMDSLGVKYIIDRTENPKDGNTFPKDRFKEIWHKDDWTIYENKKAAKRYFLTDAYLTYETPEEFEQKFFDPSFDPISTILIAKNDAVRLPELKKGRSEIELVSYAPNKVTFSAHTIGNTLLFISDTFDAGWKAFISGRETPVIRANYAFRAVVVPKGEQTVTFSYMPHAFLYGIKLCLLGIALFLSAALIQIIIKKRRI